MAAEAKSILLAVVGYRNFCDYELLKEKILQMYSTHSIKEIISGGCKGADALAEKFSKEYNIQMVIYPADWSMGRRAGPLRNTQIVEHCTDLIAFVSKDSKGTWDSINKARKKNKIVHVIEID